MNTPFRTGALALLTALPLAAASWPARILWHSARRSRSTPATVDSAAILGTAQYDGRPSAQLRGRLDHAVDVAARFPDAVLHPLGGKLPGDRYTEAQSAEKYLRDAGVTGRINAVPVGSSTKDSFEELASRSEVGRCLVITDPNHCLRAEKIARTVGIDAVASPTPYCPSQFPDRSWWESVVHESGGLVVLDVSHLLGPAAADMLETTLRRLQRLLKPSRRDRINQLEDTDT